MGLLEEFEAHEAKVHELSRLLQQTKAHSGDIRNKIYIFLGNVPEEIVRIAVMESMEQAIALYREINRQKSPATPNESTELTKIDNRILEMIRQALRDT